MSYKFPTVEEVIEKLSKFPMDAEVHIGNFSQFLNSDLSKATGITDKESYQMYPADNVEYGEFYEESSKNGQQIKRICVIIYTG